MSQWSNIYRSVILIWLIISIASVIVSIIAWRQLGEALESSRQASEIKGISEAIFQSLLDAETAQRGFSLTGKDSFLEPFRKAEVSLNPEFEQLGTMARGDSNLVSQVLELRGQSELVMDYHRRVIAERRDKGIYAAAALVSEGQGKSLMDDIRSRIARISLSNADLTSVQAQMSRAQLLRANMTSVITAITGLGAGFLALYLAQLSSRQASRESELLGARLVAERENREKSAFLANMSHEVRTPLNAILGFSELLYPELQDSKHRGFVQSIRTSATSLLHLINDLLEISKVEAGMVKLRPEPTDPREICDFIKVVFGGPAARRGVKLQCHVAPDLPRGILLDRGRLRQVLVNLVSNALKFTDHGSVEVTIAWDKQPDKKSQITLVIEVSDTGAGIPREKIEAIFKPFVQAGMHQEKERGGVGLGLSIVQNLVQLMGGTVTAASVIGKGSTFHLRFPNVPISVRLPTVESPEPGAAPNFNEFEPARILVVDDNETNRRLLAEMFAGSHHTVEFGTDGRDAVVKSGCFAPDIILLDLRMPNLNGYEAVKEIRNLAGRELTPIIAVTASSLPDDEPALQEQFNGYLRKPFSRKQLFEELSHFLPKLAPEPKQDVNSPASSAGLKNRGAIAWEQVAAQLRTMESGAWREVHDSLAINETRNFARQLEKLARDANCLALLTYAEALAHYAETYAVDDLEKHVNNFPALIERLEHPQS